MSDNKPLMPLATAVWLVDNTALSFSQISQFCQLHELEVQSIADGEDAYKMQGLNPIASGQLTMDEICLLYTSPSPRDATLSRMPSSA